MSGINASNIISVAEKYVGYLEKASNKNLDDFTANAGSNNYTCFARDYNRLMGTNLQGQPWCAIFVSLMFYKATGNLGLAKALLGGNLYSYCPNGVDNFKSKGRFYTSNPKAGDVIFFNNGIRAYHTGIVYKVDSSRVYTIEGNTSSADGVIENGGAVSKKSYSLGYSKIMGYGRPSYDNEPSSPTQSKTTKNPYPQPTAIVKKGMKGESVKWLQWELKEVGYPVAVDGIFGDSTDKYLRQLQKVCKLEIDGICGKNTIKTLVNDK